MGSPQLGEIFPQLPIDGDNELPKLSTLSPTPSTSSPNSPSQSPYIDDNSFEGGSEIRFPDPQDDKEYGSIIGLFLHERRSMGGIRKIYFYESNGGIALNYMKVLMIATKGVKFIDSRKLAEVLELVRHGKSELEVLKVKGGKLVIIAI